MSTYYSQQNGLVERGHDSIVSPLSKTPQVWEKYLLLAPWADRVPVQRSTRYPTFEFLFTVVLTSGSHFGIIDWK